MRGWWRRRSEEREGIERDAIELMEEYGDQAYYIARAHMVDTILLGDVPGNIRWTRVRQHIRKLTGRQRDVAIRDKPQK
ncbi:MAG: hypothetical protein ACSLFB_02280 [Acidimicrobiales bacterium]